MNPILRFSYLVTLLSTGLVAGVFFSERLGITPVLNTLPAGDYLRFKQAIIQAYNPAMPIIGIGGSLFYILWLVLLRQKYGTSRTFTFGLIGFLLLVASTLTTVTGELPANRQILALSARQPAQNWSELRQSTTRTIEVRTALMLLAFLFLAIASSCPLPDER